MLETAPMHWSDAIHRPDIMQASNSVATERSTNIRQHCRSQFKTWLLITWSVLAFCGSSELQADEPAPRTSLANPAVKYTVPDKPYVVMHRGPIEAVVVDNRAVDDTTLPGHRAGYHGLASLRLGKEGRNLFVPSYSGLNFEHIHDGTTQSQKILFEPRHALMELRQISDSIVELYQPPTPHWGLESCMRYELLESGTIELTFECIPRKNSYQNGYIGLFWASYIDHPGLLDIYFPGRPRNSPSGNVQWVQARTPLHGDQATHLSIADQRTFKHTEDFPLKLVFGESQWRYSAPWYFGRSRDTAFLQTFRNADLIRFSQSPSGGGAECPAWDFQWFIPDYQIDKRYQLVMRANYFDTTGLSPARIQQRAINQARAAQLGMGESPSRPVQTYPASTAWDTLQQGGKVVCLGDSVTGLYYHTGGILAYTDLLGMALKQTAPNAEYTMINAGISGHTTVNALERLDRDVLVHRPDLVTIMFGLNDIVRVPIEQYRANLITLVLRCWGTGANVVLCTPNDVISTGGRPSQKLEEYCRVIHDVGQLLSVPVADCYGEMEKLRAQDAMAWRLLLSDEIHPNLEGHKRMAEIIARTISGQATALNAVPVSKLNWSRIEAGVKAGRPIRVMAMPPADQAAQAILQKKFPSAKIELYSWSVSEKTLPQLEAEARDKVRAQRPDLVVIAVPSSAKFTSQEEFIHSYTWVLNWSLSFGAREWECVVIHPSAVDPDRQAENDDLVRKIVGAQDLKLIDRLPGIRKSLEQLLELGLQ